MRKVLLLLIFIGFQFSICLAQKRQADRYYRNGRYKDAAPYIVKLLASNRIDTDSIRAQYHYKLGNCYQHIGEESKACIHYKQSIDIDPHWECIRQYTGLLYQEKRYTEALGSFKDYYTHSLSEEALQWVSFCKRIMIEDKEVHPAIACKNLKSLNSTQSEIAPVLDGHTLRFASNKDQTDLKNMEFMVDRLNVYHIYKHDTISEHTQKDFVSLDNKYHCIPNFVDKAQLWYTRTDINRDHNEYTKTKKRKLSIYKTQNKSGNKWAKSHRIVFPGFEEKSIGHITLNSQKSVAVFVGEEKDSPSQSDLYISHKKEGKWEVPTNLGNVINTKGNELFPRIISDSLLLFSSNGHYGYGGYDLYYTHLYKTDSVGIQHLPQRINSPYDEIGIDYNRTNQTGYISSNRPQGEGQDDIYKFNADIFSYFIYHVHIRDTNSRKPIYKARLLCLNRDSLHKESDLNGKVHLKKIPQSRMRVFIHAADYRDTVVSIKAQSLLKEKVFNTIYLSPRKKEKKHVYLTHQVYFGFDSYQIPNKDRSELQRIADQLKENPSLKIYLSGHTDKIGSNRYNVVLSKNRAASIKQQLVGMGVSSKQIEMKYFGEDIPNNKKVKQFNQNAKDRRVEIYITSLGVEEQQIPNYIKDQLLFERYRKNQHGNITERNKVKRETTQGVIYFRFNSIRLGKYDKDKLDLIAQRLQNKPHLTVKVYGHTDERGSSVYNKRLSRLRAEMVGNYLKDRMTNTILIQVKGYGEDIPSQQSMKTDNQYLKHLYNRRVTITLSI
ncbi:OmpA family protein [Halosquirtibacter xylanolyticus]|uniref:OmpA family protein n=1 Tax=Halosquirtibacter xylanolyticus TaxID=3374599 RepID=UPI003748E233|nr:OmpA family protein [Prolixibacteraceae bacterium]